MNPLRFSCLIPLGSSEISVLERDHVMVSQGYETTGAVCRELVLIKSNKREEWAEEKQETTGFSADSICNLEHNSYSSSTGLAPEPHLQL